MKKVFRFSATLIPALFLIGLFPPAVYACTNDSQCSSGQVCAYSTDFSSPNYTNGICYSPQNIPAGWTSSYVPSGGIVNGGCPAGTVPSGVNCVTPSGGPSGINFTYLNQYGSAIINIINFLVAPVLMAVAFIVFLFGVYRYFILGATNETERGKGKDFVLWGVIAFVVIFSLWGLVGIVGSTLGLAPGGSAPPYPTL
ncbi:MAG: hypothetical protein KGH79_04395 [Patescibacteria group bacterium]|nr:hypothetical protein [Patescibacteria group bacterium]